MAVVFAVGVSCLVWASIGERIRLMGARAFSSPEEKQVEARDSPLALAIKDMAATAGGVYLSLVLLVSFLELTVPEKVSLGGLEVDPLAAVSVLLSIVQPYLARLKLIAGVGWW